MKAVLLIILCLSFLSCELFSSCELFKDNNTTAEPAYTAQIAWDSNPISNSFWAHIVDGNSVFFYERPFDETTALVYILTRLDVQTGEVIWRSKIKFYNILLSQPIVTNGSIYVCLEPRQIWCFDYETGELTAIAKIGTVENENVDMAYAITYYQDYIYTGLYSKTRRYFCRFDISGIDKSLGPETEQILVPEKIWEPETKRRITPQPVVYNNVVYVATSGWKVEAVELAGFDITTKERVFYKRFGGQEDGDVPFPEDGGRDNPILIHDDVLYYLSRSITAWNLNTGEQLYRHVFTWDTPNEETYMAAGMREAALFYKGKIFYTNGSFESPEGFRSINCIDAKTGKLVWNDARSPYVLDSNVIIAHDKLYITQTTGLLVYEPETGKLLGIDKSFIGTDSGRNILYNDHIICVLKNPYDSIGRLAAIYVGK